MSFELTILGSNSASPVYNRHQTAQILHIQNEYILIDCGEGTQMQLARYRFKLNKINYIFISHLHGDHYLGLVGLLSTMHLFGRTKELYLFGPPGLSEIITVQFSFSETVLNYPIHFTELETEKNKIIVTSPHFSVETIPLIHRIPCCGFLFRESPKKRRIRKNVLPENISLASIAKLKKGENVTDEAGNILYNVDEMTEPPRKSHSYAFMSDTAYSEAYLDRIRNIDLLYHEATFTSDMAARAKETFHTTTSGAAELAKKAGVDRLIIGHFSSRYRDLKPLLEEAKAVFPNSWLAIEGERFSVKE